MRNFMKVSFLVSALLLGSPVLAANGVLVSVETTTWSRYLTNNGILAHHKAVQQTDLYLALPKGFFLDAWWSSGFDKKFSGDFGDEVDWTAGWTGTIGGFGIDAGVSYFDLIKIGSTSGGIGDIVQPYVKIWRPFDLNADNQLRPFAKLEYQIPTRAGVDGGSLIHLGIQHDWNINHAWTLKHEAYALHDSGVTGLDDGIIGNYKAGLRWDINKNTYVSVPKLHITTPLTPVDDGRTTEATIGVSIGFNF